MPWRTPVYIVFPAGFLNGLSSQKLSFILQTTDKKLLYLNTLLALGVFLKLFPTKTNSVLRDSRQKNLNFPTTQSLNGLGAPALSISCLLCTSRAQQVWAGGSQATSANPLLSCQEYKWKSPPDLHLNDATSKKKEVLEGLEASDPREQLGGAAGWASLPVPENQPGLPGAAEEGGHCTPFVPPAPQEANVAPLCVPSRQPRDSGTRGKCSHSSSC